MTACDGASACASVTVQDIGFFGYHNLTLETRPHKAQCLTPQPQVAALTAGAKFCSRSHSQPTLARRQSSSPGHWSLKESLTVSLAIRLTH